MDSKLRAMWLIGLFAALCLGWSFENLAMARAKASAGPPPGAPLPGGGGGGGSGMVAAGGGARPGGGGAGGGRQRQQNLTAKVTVDQAIQAATGKTKGYVNMAALRHGQEGDTWMVHVVTKPGEGDTPGEGETYLIDPTTGVATPAPKRGGGPGGGGPGGGGRRGGGGPGGGGGRGGPGGPPAGVKTS